MLSHPFASRSFRDLKILLVDLFLPLLPLCHDLLVLLMQTLNFWRNGAFGFGRRVRGGKLVRIRSVIGSKELLHTLWPGQHFYGLPDSFRSTGLGSDSFRSAGLGSDLYRRARLLRLSLLMTSDRCFVYHKGVYFCLLPMRLLGRC